METRRIDDRVWGALPSWRSLFRRAWRVWRMRRSRRATLAAITRLEAEAKHWTDSARSGWPFTRSVNERRAALGYPPLPEPEGDRVTPPPPGFWSNPVGK